MKIYDSLKSVLSPEQLQEFKSEVESTIEEQVAEKVETEIARLDEKGVEYINFLTQKADEYVAMVTEEKIEELTTKAEEFTAMQLAEAKEELVKEYDAKLLQLESTVVDALDVFLENEISEKISNSLLESVAQTQALMPLVEGVKALFEQHYVAIDSEGSVQLAAALKKAEKLEEELSESIAEKMELTQLADRAAARLLVAEKTADLTIGKSTKVQAFFEGKSFDEVQSKVDGYIRLIAEDAETSPKKVLTLSEAVAETGEELVETKLQVETIDEDAGFLSAAAKFVW